MKNYKEPKRIYPEPCYPDYPYLDIRKVNKDTCKGYNVIRGCKISNGAYLSMMVVHNEFGNLTFVIADQHSLGRSNFQNYGESLLTIAHRAKRSLNISRSMLEVK